MGKSRRPAVLLLLCLSILSLSRAAWSAGGGRAGVGPAGSAKPGISAPQQSAATPFPYRGAPGLGLPALSLGPRVDAGVTGGVSLEQAPVPVPGPALPASDSAPSAPKADLAPAQGADGAPRESPAPEQAAAPGAGGFALAEPVSDESRREQAESAFENSARGKTVLLVGTKPSRPFILRETRRVAQELGLELVLLDDPSHRRHSARLVDDAHFIPAPLGERAEPVLDSIVQGVEDYARGRKIDAVVSFMSQHAQLTGKIRDRLSAIGIPGGAVAAADDKAMTRQLLNAIPELRVPARRIKSPEEARRAFFELGGWKFVAKAARGENSRFVIMGVDSPEAAERAFRTLDADIRAFMARPEAKSTTFNSHPGILMERMLQKLPGTSEVSVELVMQAGLPAFAIVSDTLGIGPRRDLLGGSLTFPSQQGDAPVWSFLTLAAKAARALGFRDGNTRLDMIMTKDGPQVIEVNPFMGGAAIWKAVKLLTGVSLIEQGLRALLGLKVEPGRRPEQVLVYSFMASKFSGYLESVKGLDRAKQSPGVKHVQLFVSEGGEVKAAESESYEEIGEVMVVSPTLAEATARKAEALRRIRLRTRKFNGRPGLQTGAYLQPSRP